MTFTHSNRFQEQTLKRLLVCWDLRCECSCCVEIAGHSRWSWEPMTAPLFHVLSERKWSFMMRKRASVQPEATEAVGTKQPAGEQRAEQHRNKCGRNSKQWRRGRRDAAVGKKWTSHSDTKCVFVLPHAAEMMCLSPVLSRPAGYEHQLNVMRFTKRGWPQKGK